MLAHGTPILPLVKTFILLFVCTLQEWGDFTWRVSDCEELVGGYSQEMMGLVLEGYCFTPFTNFQMMFPSLSYPVMFQVA